VISLYEVLGEVEGGLPPAPFARAAVFDPCAARGDAGMEAGVRALAAQAGMELEELREHNRCCGHGGHIRVANPGLYEEMTRNRAQASAEPYVVYCANCREVFALRGKPCAHVLDVFFGGAPDAPVPTLQQKRDNSLRVKRELMKLTQDVDFRPESHPWDTLELLIADRLQKQLDAKLISAADLREAIWAAEQSGDKLCDPDDGSFIASLIKPVLTYWVRYRQTAPGAFEVLGAYCHRMRFEQGGESR
jgi:hypothetical protein